MYDRKSVPSVSEARLVSDYDVSYGVIIYSLSDHQTASVSAEEKPIITDGFGDINNLLDRSLPTLASQRVTNIFTVYMIGLLSPLVIFYFYRNYSCWCGGCNFINLIRN